MASFMEPSLARIMSGGRFPEELQKFLTEFNVHSIDVVLAMGKEAEDLVKQLKAMTDDREEVEFFAVELVALWHSAKAVEDRHAREDVGALLRSLHVPPRAGQKRGVPTSIPPAGPPRNAVAPPKRAGAAASVNDNLPSLRKTEQDRKLQWITKIQSIRRRAGLEPEAHKAAAECGMSTYQYDVLVLGRGAWRTLRTHTSAWTKFEEWAHDERPFPFSMRRFRAFCAEKAKEGCGVSFIPAARAAAAWMGKRIGMEVPEIDDDLVKALQDQVVEQRGREIREAVPVPFGAIAALELALHEWDNAGRHTDVVVAWWVLCMVWSSMRFDDALHIRPDTLQMGPCALTCRAWQTKVDRKRRGTCFAVCDVAVAAPGWLSRGFETYKAAMPTALQAIDYWLCDVHGGKLNFYSDLSYDRFVMNARAVLIEAVDDHWPSSAGLEDLRLLARAEVLKFTAHSPRVTILNAMAHEGADANTMMAQGNWKDESMPFKYVRDRKAIPLNFILSMAKDLAKRHEAPEKMQADGAPGDLLSGVAWACVLWCVAGVWVRTHLISGEAP